MKPFPPTFLLLCATSVCLAEEPAKPIMRDAATHDDLVKRYRMAEANDPMKQMAPSQGEDPAKNRPTDILADSDFLCFNGTATLVPKRAIISLPENLKARTQLAPNVPFRVWSDFYAANRGWITTIEISRAQAEGREDLGLETKDTIAKSGNIIVAVYKGGPISLLPLKPDAVKSDADKTSRNPTPAKP